MISNFPELLKPLFVCMGAVKAKDVIDFLKPKPQMCSMNEDERRVWDYSLAFINAASAEGILCIII